MHVALLNQNSVVTVGCVRKNGIRMAAIFKMYKTREKTTTLSHRAMLCKATRRTENTLINTLA